MNDVTKSTCKKSSFGAIALIVAFIALTIALVPKAYEYMYPKPTVSQEITESVKQKAESLKDKAKSFFKKEQNKPVNKQIENKVDSDKIKKISKMASLSLAFLSFVLSVVSYVRHENRRLYRSAFMITAVAILANFYLLAVALLFLLYFIYFGVPFIDNGSSSDVGSGATGSFGVRDVSGGGFSLFDGDAEFGLWIWLAIIALPGSLIASFIFDISFIAIIAIVIIAAVIGFIVSLFSS